MARAARRRARGVSGGAAAALGELALEGEPGGVQREPGAAGQRSRAERREEEVLRRDGHEQRDHPLGHYRMDFVVEGTVIVEIKSVTVVLPIFEAQLHTYLRITQKRIGPLINFNVPLLKEGITRKILSDAVARHREAVGGEEQASENANGPT